MDINIIYAIKIKRTKEDDMGIKLATANYIMHACMDKKIEILE